MKIFIEVWQFGVAVIWKYASFIVLITKTIADCIERYFLGLGSYFTASTRDDVPHLSSTNSIQNVR